MSYEGLGWFATLFTLGVFLSNTGLILRIRAARTTEGRQPFEMYGQLLNGVWWCLYATVTDIQVILVCNGAGLVIALWGLWNFTVYAVSPAEQRRVLLTSIFVVLSSVLFALVVIAFYRHDTAVAILGVFASISSVFLMASPLAHARETFLKKNAEALSPVVLFCSFFTALLWSIYGFLVENRYILLPNAVSLWLVACQWLLYCRYTLCRSAAPPGLPR